MNNTSTTQLGVEKIKQFFDEKIEKSLLAEYQDIIKTIKADGLKEEVENITKGYEATHHLNIRLNQLLQLKQHWESISLKDDQWLARLTLIIDDLDLIDSNNTNNIEQKKQVEKAIRILQKVIVKSSESKEVKQAFDHILQATIKVDEIEKSIHIIDTLKKNNPSIGHLIIAKRQKITEKFEPNQWITDASINAKNIYLNVSHVGKLTHSSARSKKIKENHGNLNAFKYEKLHKDGFVSTYHIKDPILDYAYTDSKYSPIAEFMTIPVGNKSLGEAVCEDINILSAFSTNDEQLQSWINGFLLSLESEKICTHELLKQVYFPVKDGYHLLCPLMSSTLAQAVDERVWQTRQKDMPAKLARKNAQFFNEPDTFYPITAKLQVTQSKHHNVSSLNGKRSGSLTLLPSAPPPMHPRAQQPIDRYKFKENTVFNQNLAYIARASFRELRNLLLVLRNKQLEQNLVRKKRIISIINDIVDVVLAEVALLQNKLKDAPEFDLSQLPLHEQYWLGSYWQDEDFQNARQATDWQEDLAKSFAHWINAFIDHKGGKLSLGTQYRQQWQKILTPALREFIAQTEASRLTEYELNANKESPL
ncbi:type I-F CRISPR-associated protein Csy1 [Psychrobacter pygoscelis]|uniref:type I-F CRISPR-associated protein Csy1 n=1 Tax=Psychrobacter pygoscelis TaxID=2488563 RepID=UPI00103FD022|nr:type I-F CRISPR-associated protein Csy1 [Psychrobacter pygoscelis]